MEEDNPREQKKKPDRRAPRAPRKVTASYLENSALYYLQRFSTSTENLRRVMMRKIDKSCAYHDSNREDAAELLDQMIKRFLSSGLLDDQVYAKARVTSLHRHGSSQRQIRGKLLQKGLAADVIDKALRSLNNEANNPELEAAVTYARRRRLGPWRDPATREERQEKDLAAMARSGFSYDIARRVIGAETIDLLESELKAV